MALIQHGQDVTRVTHVRKQRRDSVRPINSIRFQSGLVWSIRIESNVAAFFALIAYFHGNHFLSSGTIKLLPPTDGTR